MTEQQNVSSIVQPFYNFINLFNLLVENCASTENLFQINLSPNKDGVKLKITNLITKEIIANIGTNCTAEQANYLIETINNEFILGHRINLSSFEPIGQIERIEFAQMQANPFDIYESDMIVHRVKNSQFELCTSYLNKVPSFAEALHQRALQKMCMANIEQMKGQETSPRNVSAVIQPFYNFINLFNLLIQNCSTTDDIYQIDLVPSNTRLGCSIKNKMTGEIIANIPIEATPNQSKYLIETITNQFVLGHRINYSGFEPMAYEDRITYVRAQEEPIDIYHNDMWTHRIKNSQFELCTSYLGNIPQEADQTHHRALDKMNEENTKKIYSYPSA